MWTLRQSPKGVHISEVLLYVSKVAPVDGIVALLEPKYYTIFIILISTNIPKRNILRRLNCIDTKTVLRTLRGHSRTNEDLTVMLDTEPGLIDSERTPTNSPLVHPFYSTGPNGHPGPIRHCAEERPTK